MHRRTDEYQTTIEELSNAHRVSEDGRLNALQELESKKYELADLQARLDSTQDRLNNLQQEFIRAESERDALNEALRRLQNSVNRAMVVTRFRPGIDTVTYVPEIFLSSTVADWSG